jgi:microsomal dipeptidase-like Zn-dependent dipeptidase
VTVLGFADLHNHQFAHLGFGGREFFGRPTGPIDKALPWCLFVHGPGGLGDVVGTFMKWAYGGGGGPGHLVGGYPQFDGWPRWNSVTHQTVHVDWLHRAWEGGLRLMVMLAVNNEWMCTLPGFQLAPGRSPRDMEAADLQLDAALALEAELDQQAGGPGLGWYRIVRSADEASATIAAGNLAVVLGIEVDYLFDGYPGQPPTADQVRASVQTYYDRGVRYVFPLHFGDNAFGGTALQNPMESANVSISLQTPLGPVNTPYVVQAVDGKSLGYEHAVVTTGFVPGLRNSKGLTDLGRVLIEELMAHQMLFDVDHMSWQTRSDVLDIAEAAHYPVISGHSGFIDTLLGDKLHEGQQTGAEVDRIRSTGGMVAPIIAQGSLNEVRTWRRPDGSSITHECGGSSNSFVQAYLYAVDRMGGGPVGLGTDFNGFAGVPRPTDGVDAEKADPNTQLARVDYPFIAAVSGEQIDRCTAGQRSFDINDDGLAHVGMLPDFIAHLQAQGVRPKELEPLLHSAEAFAQVWSRATPRNLGDHFYTTSTFERDAAVATFGYKLEGTSCFVYGAQQPDARSALFRLFNDGNGDHFYTASEAERDSVVAGGEYKLEGTQCYVDAAQLPGTVPLFRLANTASGDHFYTTSAAERDGAVATGGYHMEGIACYVHLGQDPGTGPLFRLVNTGNGEHFYTTSKTESDSAVASGSYALEGTACFVYGAQQPDARASLYRLFNDGNGDHFYTISGTERDGAAATGYRFEGTACYVDAAQLPGTSPLFRLANVGNGDHFYTTSATERDTAVATGGYHMEGIACFVRVGQVPGTVPLFRLVKVS